MADPIDTAKLLALANAATPGPWCVQGPWPHATVYVNDAAMQDSGIEPTHVATMAALTPEGKSTTSDPDAAFIAAARTALPEALHEIDRLRSALAKASNLAESSIEMMREDLGEDEDELAEYEQWLADWRSLAKGEVP